MNGFITVLVAFAILAAYVIYKRIKAGTYRADNDQFSQAGVTVYFKQQRIQIKGRDFDIDAITNVRTEAPLRGQALAFDCVISISDFKTPEHRIRFVSQTKANQFMQRLVTAIEKAGGPAFR